MASREDCCCIGQTARSLVKDKKLDRFKVLEYAVQDLGWNLVHSGCGCAGFSGHNVRSIVVLADVAPQIKGRRQREQQYSCFAELTILVPIGLCPGGRSSGIRCTRAELFSVVSN
jgi:hypothetical protein